MSKIFAIEAKEQVYDGMHGIVDRVVGVFDDYYCAWDEARDLSRDLISDYNIVEKAGWDEEAVEQGLKVDSLEYEDYIYDCIEDDLSCVVWEVGKTSKSIDELNELFNEDPDGFVEKYCIDTPY